VHAGALKKLQQIKPVWREPQGGTAEDLEESIQEYYAAIKDGRGGIFIAVCRGKVRLFLPQVCDFMSVSMHCSHE
jgi:hypothetical protein